MAVHTKQIHESFVTTTRGLRRNIPPMVLWERAKKLGVWNPADFDLTQDAEDWKQLNDAQREYVLLMTAQFISGEEAVTLDLLPLIKAVAESGHLEEEMFLTTFLWEEAKHIDFFSRVLDAWGVSPGDLEAYHPPAYTKLFYEDFPRTMNALYTDPSPENMIRASVMYNMGIEGVLAETGYFTWYSVMDSANIFPGTRQGIRKIQLDESRHIAFGVWLCSRLLAEDPGLFSVVEEVMEYIKDYQYHASKDTHARIGKVPFEMDYDAINDFGVGQHRKRMARLRRVLGKSLEEIYKMDDILEDEPALA